MPWQDNQMLPAIMLEASCQLAMFQNSLWTPTTHKQLKRENEKRKHMVIATFPPKFLLDKLLYIEL